MIEFKNIPEEFLKEYLALKAELKLEKINSGKDKAYISELEDKINKLSIGKNEQIIYLENSLRDKQKELSNCKSNLIRSNTENNQLKQSIKKLNPNIIKVKKDIHY